MNKQTNKRTENKADLEKYTPAENRTRVCLAHLAETEFRPVTIPLRYRRHGPSINRKLYPSQISLEKYKPRQYETQRTKGNYFCFYLPRTSTFLSH